MDLFAHLIGVVDAANVLVGKATLLMLGIALFFKAATKAIDAYWCFRKSLRKHKKKSSKERPETLVNTLLIGRHRLNPKGWVFPLPSLFYCLLYVAPAEKSSFLADKQSKKLQSIVP